MATNPTFQSAGGLDNTFKTVSVSGLSAPLHPGYVSGRFYPGLNSAQAAAVAGNTAVLIFTLFSVALPVAPAKIGLLVTAGGAGSTAKFGLWASGIGSKRPSGLMLPGSGSNTALDTSGAAALIGNVANITLTPGLPYWFGSMCTATAPTVISLGGNNLVYEALVGRAAFGAGAILGLSTPFTFGNDITALDLTNATFIDVGAAGSPIGYLQAP